MNASTQSTVTQNATTHPLAGLRARAHIGTGIRLSALFLLIGLLVALASGAYAPATAMASTPCPGGTIEGSYSSPATHGSITTEGQVDCYKLSGFATGQEVTVGLRASAVSGSGPFWRVVDQNGSTICAGFQVTSSGCELSGTSSWSIEVEGYGGNGAFSYNVAVRNVSEPQGCSSGLGEPGEWSFAKARINGSISGTLGAQCYTFTRAEGEADGAYWFRTVRTAGSLDPQWTVYGPSGGWECSGTTSSPAQACDLRAYGKYALVISSANGEESGSYFVSPRSLSKPAGCSSITSLSYSATPASGSIATAGEADCYTLSGASFEDALSISSSVSGSSGANPGWAVVDNNGKQVCGTWAGAVDVQCELSGAAPWSLIVYDETGGGTFSYNVAVRNVSEPQGCSPGLGEPGEWSFTKARINGSISGTLGAQCYTFTRAEGEADGAYWFRTVRTAGSLDPQWTVYGPSGARECSGGESTAPGGGCRLLASGHYVLVVDGNPGGTGSYFLNANRLDSPDGCTTLLAQQFGAAAVVGNLSTAGSVDCRTLGGVSAGDRVRVGMIPSNSPGGSPRWSLISGDGKEICSSNYSGYRSLCGLSGAPGWSLLIYGESAGTFSYNVAVRNVSEPQGCSSGLGEPGEWSFTKARINGSISGTLGAQCYTFTRAEGEADGAYWFRTVRTAGGSEPELTVYGPTGEPQCSNNYGSGLQQCDLAADGKYALVVESNTGEGSGSYVVSARRLNVPTGCASLKAPTFGIASTHGDISTAGEVDCYSVRLGSGDELVFHETGAANGFALLGENGNIICQYTGNVCRVADDATYSVLFYAGGPESGNYQFDAACEDAPCGQTETSINEVSPTRVGQGKSTTVLLRGHDLELLESVRIKRSGSTFEGRIQSGSDGRSVEVRFDLSEAPVGVWEIEGEFADGTKRQLPGALHVEPAGAPIVTVHLVGREIFRTLHKIPVSVEVSNAGNVDAMGVPVVLNGLPAGSTVEPQFELATPEGELESPTFSPAQFDPETDAIETNEGMAVPLIVPRVPAEGSIQLDFNVTVPTGGVSYLLQARTGQCLADPAGKGGVNAAIATTAGARTEGGGADPVTPCADEVGKSLADSLIDLVPGVSCLKAGGDIGTALAKGIVWPMLGIDRPKIFTASSIIDFGLNGAGCVSLIGGKLAKPVVSKLTEKFVTGAGLVGDWAPSVDACYGPTSQSKLPQRQVTAIDPNELVGPNGVGPQHYISGEQPLQYRVFFENTPSATAPAQRIEITDQLDTSKFDPASVLFSSFRFGHQSLVLPYPEAEVDETIDLQPAEDLRAHVTASVTTGGKIQIVLQAIDPNTLEPPSDPSVGLLPPNASPPEGEGSVDFAVAPRDLASGTTLSNQASIIFDDNAPITTNAWANTLDKAAPTPNVSATSGKAPLEAEVSWEGADDASGIDLWKIEVSKNGGPFEFWRSAPEAGSDAYVAPAAGSYSFRATAYDNAGNTGQSALSAVTLSTASGGGSSEPPNEPTGPAATDGRGAPQAAGNTAPVTTRQAKPKSPHCKKGFQKKKSHGRTVCAKVKRKHRSKQ